MISRNPYRASGTFVGSTYVRRNADQQLRKEIDLNKRYPFLLSSRQSGKSSLIANTMAELDDQEFYKVFIDLTSLGPKYLHSYSKCLESIIKRIDNALPLSKSEIVLDDDLEQYLREISSKKPNKRIIVFIDEVDKLLSFPYKDDFFGLIRYFFNLRAFEREFEAIQFILSGAAEPKKLISNPNISPFNVGAPILLEDLSRKQVKELVQHLKIDDWDVSENLASQIYKYTSGSVYLTQLILEKTWDFTSESLEKIASSRIRIDEKVIDIIANEVVKEAPDNPHFFNMYVSIQDNPENSDAFKKLFSGSQIGKEELSKLKMVGITNGDKPYRNLLYQYVFGQSEELSLNHLFRIPNLLKEFWHFLNTDASELPWGQSTEKDFGGTLRYKDSDESIANQPHSYAEQVELFLETLNLSLTQFSDSTLPIVSTGLGLLKIYLDLSKVEPSYENSIVIVTQFAYLQSFRTELSEINAKNVYRKKLKKVSLKSLIESQLNRLEEAKFNSTQVDAVMIPFGASELAEHFSSVLVKILRQIALDESVTRQLVDRVIWGTNRYLYQAVNEAGERIAPLAESYRTAQQSLTLHYISIDTYLDEWIASRPHEPVFAESFAFKDIYVPLKAQPLTWTGEMDTSQTPVVLEQWARQMLHDSTKNDQVMFVQGGPGRGKSVFCRMFADWVRCHEHPRWTPILIRLRDISVLSKDFEETLSKAINWEFAKTNSGWLTDRSINFLFILDGFDELLMEGRTTQGLNVFLEQVGRFQEQCARNSEKGHRVLITGRSLALQGMEKRLPNNLERIELLPMDDELQRQWFNRWGALIGQDTNHLLEVLQYQYLPKPVQELAQEPLLLYLLAAMYRDGELRLEMFKGSEAANAVVLIYERTLDWVLTKQRAEGYQKDEQTPGQVTARDLTPYITELAPQNLRRILQEAGMCVVQSGMEFAQIKSIESRLAQDSNARVFLEDAQKKLDTDDTPLRNALTAFYLQEGRQGEGSIEFVHKSFGEFLCAERIVESLIDICQPGRNREYDIDDTAFCWMLYDLMGFQVLTPEIVGYITSLLVKHPDFEPKRLHKRLYDFYWRWSEGEFIDASPENLPQQNMRLLRERAPNRKETIGQRQVDVYAGLNTMIMLWELHRYSLTLLSSKEATYDTSTKTPDISQNPLLFHPCKPLGIKVLDKQRLLRIIGISHFLGAYTFIERVGSFLNNIDLCSADLSNTNLRHVNLRDANLRDANLRDANLRDANLHSVSLRGADLSDANLSNANLSNANLRGANLHNANLCNTNLRSADLCGANLRGANLYETDLTGVILSDVQWDHSTRGGRIQGIERVVDAPETLKYQLGFHNPDQST